MNKQAEERLWNELHGLRHKLEIVTQATTIITTKLEAAEKAAEKEAEEKEKRKASAINTIKWAVGIILTIAGLYIAYLSI